VSGILSNAAPDPDTAERVHAALVRLLKEDIYLLQADVNERSLSHRLAIYLEELFPGWAVDCEYNRDDHEPKRLQLNPEQILSDDEEGTTVYPDIIVHKRGCRSNLLAIEIKKISGGSEANDLRKLRALRTQLGYQVALFVRFATGGRANGVAYVRWSED